MGSVASAASQSCAGHSVASGKRNAITRQVMMTKESAVMERHASVEMMGHLSTMLIDLHMRASSERRASASLGRFS